MQIEIAEPGRMTQTGSSLLRLIQNNNMPVLDLFVRESVQNSLDAGLNDSQYVDIQFLTGTFSNRKFSKNLEKISEQLMRKYSDPYYDYIAVRDFHTAGLTGPLHFDDVRDNNYGNLLKLVYEISKPQEQEGSGGSWGLGKTVYFRVGIGIVLYYSRIRTDAGFQSRMAITMVENENAEDALIPSVGNKLKRGIAWWGCEIGNNKTQPVTDDAEIRCILENFNIAPYQGSNTGTTVVIPYINKQKLLHNNVVEYLDSNENSIHPFWQDNLEEYLSISLQRWYAPRMNNPKYPFGRFLRAKINDIPLGNERMEPEFQIIQSLYNRANGNIASFDVLQNSYSEETKVEDITLRNVLGKSKAGAIAYVRIDRKILKMDYPDNKPSPYMYFNCEIRGRESNKPIICFVRKPGMIVAYENLGNWADGIPEADSDHYIFAVFVLNSCNHLKGMPDYSLEEYARKSEMADHTSWGDFNIGAFNPRIISKSQGQIAKKISAEFGIQDEKPEMHVNSGLGKFFGDILLPPENYGRKPRGCSVNPDSPRYTEKHRFVTLRLFEDQTEYSADYMILHLSLRSTGGFRHCEILTGIDSETGSIQVRDWEMQMGLTMPFEITSAEILFKTKKEKYEEYKVVLNRDKRISGCVPFDTELVFSEKNKGYAIRFSTNSKIPVNADIKIRIRLYRRDLKPVIMFKEEEE